MDATLSTMKGFFTKSREKHHSISVKLQGKKLNNLSKGLDVRCTGAHTSKNLVFQI